MTAWNAYVFLLHRGSGIISIRIFTVNRNLMALSNERITIPVGFDGLAPTRRTLTSLPPEPQDYIVIGSSTVAAGAKLICHGTVRFAPVVSTASSWIVWVPGATRYAA